MSKALDISTVALGLRWPVTGIGRGVNTAQPPPPYSSEATPNDAPFPAQQRKALQNGHVSRLSLNRHWKLQVETKSTKAAEVPKTLTTGFQQFDVFVTTWTACMSALCEDAYRSPSPEHQATKGHSATLKPWDLLRRSLPSDLAVIRLWATTAAAVFHSTKLPTTSKALSPSKVSVANGSFGSSAAANQLKFSQATLSIPIAQLIMMSPTGDKVTTNVGDGADFATSRTLRVDVVKSLLNEVALIMIAGGAAPAEIVALEAAVPATHSYQSSVGIVGLQVQLTTSSTTTAEAPASASDNDDGAAVLRNVTLEIQILAQSSANAGKKAIEAAFRELLPPSLFEAPCSLSVAILHCDGGGNVTLRSPRIPPTPPSTAVIGAPPPKPSDQNTESTRLPPSSWTEAVNRGASATSANTKGASMPPRSPAAASLPPTFPTKKAQAASVTSPISAQPTSSKAALAKSTAAASTLPVPKSAATSAQKEGTKRKEISVPEAGAAAIERTTVSSPEVPTMTLSDVLQRQSELLLMHAQDLSLLRAQFDELLFGADPCKRPTASNHSSLTISNSMSSSGISASTTIPALASHAPLVATHLLERSIEAVRHVLLKLKAEVVGGVDTGPLRASDLEATIGPFSKMLSQTLESGDRVRMESYRGFQQTQKSLLTDAISAYAVLFAKADEVVTLFEAELRVLNLEASEWRGIDEQFHDAMKSLLAARETVVSSVHSAEREGAAADDDVMESKTPITPAMPASPSSNSVGKGKRMLKRVSQREGAVKLNASATDASPTSIPQADTCVAVSSAATPNNTVSAAVVQGPPVVELSSSAQHRKDKAQPPKVTPPPVADKGSKSSAPPTPLNRSARDAKGGHSTTDTAVVAQSSRRWSHSTYLLIMLAAFAIALIGAAFV